MFRSFLALTLAWVLAAAPARAADAAPPIAFTERTLANGLKVLASVDRSTPNVAIQMWYGVGSKDDPAGRSGFAHLFEHLMFKATRDFPAETLDRLTEDVGGQNNASTADDFTNYFEVVPAHHLQRLLWVEATRLDGLVVDEANFRSERDVVKEELRQRVLASPYGRLFYLYLPQATYARHPYKRPGIGSIEDLDAATVDDVRAFHQAFYRPDNVALVVVGNFDPDQLNAWVDAYFGKLQAPAAALTRVVETEPPRTKSGVFTGYGPNVPLPAVAITWLGARAGDPDAPALTLLDAILSSGKSSRLYDSLVYRQQIAAEAFSNADLPQQAGMFMVGAIMSAGHDVAEGEAALLAEVKRLRDAPPTLAELTEARNELMTARLRARETIQGRGFVLGEALALTGDAGNANRALSDLAAVTPADIQRVAVKYLADDRRMTIRYLPESQRPPGAAPPVPSPPMAEKVVYTGPINELRPEAARTPPPPLGAPVTPVLPKPVEKTLANGLRVIVARSTDLPLVTADLTFRAGAWIDPPGLAGAASMTAAMLTEGTKTRTAPQIAQQIESLGASLQSGGDADSGSVTLNALRDQLPRGLAIMADVARNPAFAAEELDRQRTLALDGLSVAYRDAGQLAGFATAPMIFAGTPFGHLTDGTPASLRRLTPADLAHIHKAFYRPDNAVLVLTGDLSPEAGFQLAQAAFGDWAVPSAPLPAQPAITPAARPRVVAIDLAGSGQAAVLVAAAATPRSSPDYYPGVVANALLGAGYSSRLNLEIRIKRGLSYGASSAFSARRTTGLFRASAQTKPESAMQVLDLMQTEIARLRTEPARSDELAARKSTLIGSFGRVLATTTGLANVLGELALYDVPLSELNAYTGKVEAVTAEQVETFARTWLDPAKASVIIAGDGKGFVAELKARRSEAEVIAADKVDFDAPGLGGTPRTP